ncbi:uncharacterized protein Z520_11087 [Fonsecaea multimorphosa CBS 102226]|uniref:BZIP domain-containing protein n=1 Tax=Fonsecaea multimorphosa CBS 102226 TaxID=1442371 RepID=A0A0D2JJ62_9EURO|nr:uncharacterized protein Z520_11087 [Fonsecaea multimorphosa CBS 102226]KIX93232.1 hypothetical protein Z520_11087 [Fonsecaea multimorphosa CBS 102226]OAL18464.1 hypothetical protein AYO22_10660 [Fonsecaea multimorphosa]
MSIPKQSPTQSSRHSQPSTTTAPGLVPSSPQDHGALSQEDIDSLFSFDVFSQQDNLEEWFRQVSTEEMWQHDHEAFDEFWGDSGAGTDQPQGSTTTTYQTTHELLYGSRLEEDDGNDDGTPVGGREEGVTHCSQKDRQRDEASADNKDNITTTGAHSSTKTDSPSPSDAEQKRKMQNRQAQRAFRERRVKYVHDLENKVKDLLLYAESLKHENQMLRARGQWLSGQLKSFYRQRQASSRRSPS